MLLQNSEFFIAQITIHTVCFFTRDFFEKITFTIQVIIKRNFQHAYLGIQDITGKKEICIYYIINYKNFGKYI